MSIKVELAEVAAVAAEQVPYAYLLTVSEDSSAHAVAITVAFGEGVLECSAGGTSCRNATARPNVSLLWPPADVGGYSLIVDGEASVDDSTVTIVPARAVRHRPAVGGGSDCGPVSLG